MIFFEKSIFLEREKISGVVEEVVGAYSHALGEKAGDIVKLNLTLEELLLRFYEKYPRNKPCTIKGRKIFGRTTIELSQSGPGADVVVPDESMQATYDILARLDVYPKYSYTTRKGGINRVIVPVAPKEKKKSSLIVMAISIALAIACYFLMGLLPAGIESTIVTSFISPVFSKLISVLTGIATVFVFLAVISGIIGIGDISTFGKIGKKLCLSMGFTYSIAAVILAVAGISVFGVAASSAMAEGGGFAQAIALVLDIIPDNFIQPFVDDNDLQVITISIFLGALILILGEKIPTLKKVVLDLSDLMNLAMMTFMKLLPIIVFLGILNTLYTIDLESIASVWLVLVAFGGGAVVLVVITAARASFITKVSYSTIFKCQLPALMINIATASQVSALPEHMICLKEKFGIDEKFVDFGLPLGIVVFMPCGAIFCGVTAWTLATVGGTILSPDIVVKLVFVAIIVAIAAPPIPGSAIAVMPIILSACGISLELMPLGIIIATVVGYFLPSFNCLMIQLQLLISAHKLGKIDPEVLRSQK